MKNTDKLIVDGCVVTVDHARSVLPTADVRVVEGKITEIGPNLDRTGMEIIDAAGMIVMPGLVDTHRHTWQSVLRHRHSDSDFGAYRMEMLGSVGERYRPLDVFVGTKLGAIAALESGTTTLVDWSHAINTPEHADAGIQALQQSGIRAVFAHGWPRQDPQIWGAQSTTGHPPDITRVRRELLPSDDALVTLAMAARGPEMVEIETVRRDFQLAADLGIRTTMHVGAGPLGPKFRAIAAMQKAGMLTDALTLVHLCTSADEELLMMADAGVGASVGPQLEMMMAGLGVPAIARLRRAGVSVGLSGDSETAAAGDMFNQMHIALAAMRLLANNDLESSGQAQVTVSQMLDMATREAAESIGLGDVVGSIEVGKRADILLIDATATNLAPVSDPTAAIVVGAHPGNVDTVLVDGNIVKQAGKLLGDTRSLLADAADSRRYLLEEEQMA